MTFRERQLALLADLLEERAGAEPHSWWADRLDQKIGDMRGAIFGGIEDD